MTNELLIMMSVFVAEPTHLPTILNWTYQSTVIINLNATDSPVQFRV